MELLYVMLGYVLGAASLAGMAFISVKQRQKKINKSKERSK